MKKLYLLVAGVWLLSSCQSLKKERYDVLIHNANIINVEAGTVTQDQLIAISKDTIQVVEASAGKRKYKARQVLDAKGKFVMPGLWDNHVHFRGGDSLIEENKDLLPLFLASGITTVRDAGGDITPSVLTWQSQIQEGDLAGPTIFTSGPKLDGPKPAWPGSIKVTNSTEIEAALDSLQVLGAQYVKMYDGTLSSEAFYEIIKAAEKRGLKTTGHMPMSADLMKAIDLGLDGSEHLYYTLKACSPLADSLTALNLGYGMMDKIIETYDPALAKHVFQKLRTNNVFITPTLYIGRTLAQVADVDHSQDSLLAYIGPRIQRTYRGRVESAKRAKASGSTFRQKMENQTMKMMVPMFDAGVNLLAGSDCGAFNSYVYPGESLHGEPRMLVEAGLSPQQALTTSLVNGPKFFGQEKFYGSVGKGKVADLILLDKNPLVSIENASGINAVITKGKVYDRKALDKMLQALKK
ncbi:amidohydrolase family protein [Rufibacter tibetensis]|uniref:Amidohydrolase n=1 Tax=Rufibacter tibetensis TaxID=512763 RepID=A0A0P0CGI8_9BACT|nr:amidohydrolase family protein [Rufibacter tibetensis]ALJ01055.1 amidohydrolase [Rufibacter tibetensis]